jgi:hypothetical protein
MRLASISKGVAVITGAITSLIAVVTLVASAVKWDRDNKRQRLEEWETVVVYSILSKAPRTGLTFEQIKQQYTGTSRR